MSRSRRVLSATSLPEGEGFGAHRAFLPVFARQTLIDPIHPSQIKIAWSTPATRWPIATLICVNVARSEPHDVAGQTSAFSRLSLDLTQTIGPDIPGHLWLKAI